MTDRSELPSRLRQRVRDRSAGGRVARRPKLAAARAVRPVRRAAVGHRVHRAARAKPPLVAVPHPAVGGAHAVRAAAAGRAGLAETAGSTAVPTPPNQLRWNPLPMPAAPTDFVEAVRWSATATEQQPAAASHLYAANRSMERRAFYNADGEMLIVPQQGALSDRHRTRRARGRAAGDRSDSARRALPGRAARRRGARLRLRELRRRVQAARPRRRSARTDWRTRATSMTPVAAYEDLEGDFELVAQVPRRAVARARWTTRRSTSSRGTATTRRTSTTCGASTRSARSATTIPTRRSSSCCTAPSDTPGVDDTATSWSSRRACWRCRTRSARPGSTATSPASSWAWSTARTTPRPRASCPAARACTTA